MKGYYTPHMEEKMQYHLTAICPQCKKEFFKNTKIQKYCTPECRRDWKNRDKKDYSVCEVDAAKKGYPFSTVSADTRRSANMKLQAAVNLGKLRRPLECSMCGDAGCRIVGHHEDYGKPFEVIWVCCPCHAKIHTLQYYLDLEKITALATRR